jgi:hypothetical protein
MLDGYPTSNPGFVQVDPIHGNPIPGAIPATQRSTIIDPVATWWPYFADEATAEYYFGDIGSPVAGGWLREVVTSWINGTAPALVNPPIRMFQSSHPLLSCRMFQVSNATNSLRNYGSGNSHL